MKSMEFGEDISTHKIRLLDVVTSFTNLLCFPYLHINVNLPLSPNEHVANFRGAVNES